MQDFWGIWDLTLGTPKGPFCQLYPFSFTKLLDRSNGVENKFVNHFGRESHLWDGVLCDSIVNPALVQTLRGEVDQTSF